jgi:hypothetical protein
MPGSSVAVKHLAGALVTITLLLAEGPVEEREGQAWAASLMLKRPLDESGQGRQSKLLEKHVMLLRCLLDFLL